MSSFQKVARAKTKLRMALTGVSGSGKTLGALMIAAGLAEGWDHVALIDTEHERARAYANREEYGIGEFLYAPLAPPYSTDRYISLAREAAEIVGPDGVVIIDSLSHAWNNEGGVLEVKDKIASRAGMNSYTAWNEAGKLQNSLINAILSINCHTIVTMRSKMEYALQENERGKLQPVKLGLSPIQRDDTEYEFDVVLDIARNHVATASKDVTFLDKYGDVITPDLGRELKAWLNDGIDPGTIMAQKPITANQWEQIKREASGNREIVRAAMAHFGAERASDLKQGQMDAVLDYVRRCVEQEAAPYEDCAV